MDQQRTFPWPLGKTFFLATLTADPGDAWAFCSRGEHCNALFCHRFHDLSSYLSVIASILLPGFVTLENDYDGAPEDSHYVTPFTVGNDRVPAHGGCQSTIVLLA